MEYFVTRSHLSCMHMQCSEKTYFASINAINNHDLKTDQNNRHAQPLQM